LLGQEQPLAQSSQQAQSHLQLGQSLQQSSEQQAALALLLQQLAAFSVLEDVPARFYARTFPGSSVGAVHLTPANNPWRVTPAALMKAVTGADRAAAKRAFEVMMTMGKIDVAAIEKAVRGE
jgi:hypothetical protein